jgi:hypothetical protein
MKTFHFDFVETAAPTRRLQWLVFVWGVVVLGAVAWHFQSHVRPLVQARQALLRAQSQSPGNKPGAVVKPEVLAKAWSQAQATAAQLQTPWSAFFAGLGEAGTASKVAFLSIEPNPVKGQVTLMAEARSLGSMLQFVTALQGREEFSDVVLQTHTVNRADPELPVRFRLVARWRVSS